MAAGIKRSNRQTVVPFELDDAGNLYVSSGGLSSPTLAGGSTDGIATELEVAATVAAAANNQTLAAAAGRRTYISGFMVGGLGATAASVIVVTIVGLSVTMTFRVSIPAGAGVIVPPLVVSFSRPIPASADNTAIVVTIPSFGAGNTAADAAAWGFRI